MSVVRSNLALTGTTTFVTSGSILSHDCEPGTAFTDLSPSPLELLGSLIKGLFTQISPVRTPADSVRRGDTKPAVFAEPLRILKTVTAAAVRKLNDAPVPRALDDPGAMPQKFDPIAAERQCSRESDRVVVRFRWGTTASGVPVSGSRVCVPLASPSGIPRLRRGTTALAHAVHLVETGRIGGAITAPAEVVSLLQSTKPCLLVQRYTREIGAQRDLQKLADDRGCRYSRLKGVYGVGLNVRKGQPDGTGEWSWRPCGTCHKEFDTRDGAYGRIEGQECVFCVIEADDPRALTEVYDEWKDSWEVPCKLITGTGDWPPSSGGQPGQAAIANVVLGSDGKYFITYSRANAGTDSFSGYRKFSIRVNEELAPYLGS